MGVLAVMHCSNAIEEYGTVLRWKSEHFALLIQECSVPFSKESECKAAVKIMKEHCLKGT